MFKYKITELSEKKIENLRKSVDLVFITVTESERKAFCDVFRPLPSIGRFVQIFNNMSTYYVGRVGHFPIAYTECSMGFIGPTGSLLTTERAIQFWNPKAIIMPGIAFGIDKKKQKLADILISEAIIPYEFERISENEVEPRAVPSMAPPGNILLERFKKTFEWHHKVGKKRLAIIHVGGMLSGSKLVDNIQYRDDLVERYKYQKPVGGEMEGAGISSACAGNKNIEFIVAKGICDWGDGKKNKRNQPKASRASVSLCSHVFSQRNAFHDLNLIPLNDSEIIAQELAEIIDTRKGSKLWLLYILRADILTNLISDLSTHQQLGLDNQCCDAVLNDLQLLTELSMSIPKEVFGGKKLSHYFYKLSNDFQSWTSIQGNSAVNQVRRGDLVKKLSKTRKKISKKIAKSYFGLSVYTNIMVTEEMLIAQKTLVNNFPQQFPGLSKAIKRMTSRR